MEKVKFYFECFDDIKTAKRLFLNGFLSFNAMQEIINYNYSVIKDYFIDIDVETQNIVNENFWDWIS